jgi:hypothetical protein
MPTTLAISNAVTVPLNGSKEGDTALVELGADASLLVCEGRVEADVLRVPEDLVAPAAGMVVEANPTPLGPILMVSPSTTIVVGVAEGPILYVVPEITTWDVPTPKVTSPTVVVVKPDPDPIKVVEAKPTPPGPMLIVSPFTTMVVGDAEGPMLYVVPEMTT